MDRFRTFLLATTFLTTASFSASAGVLTESIDFPATAPGTSVPFATFQQVNGTVDGNVGDFEDVFTFTGLTAGGDYILTGEVTASDIAPSNDLTINGTNFLNDIGVTKTIFSGIVSGTTLTVDVTPSACGCVSEGYKVVLAAVQQQVPEPASLALFSVGLAGAALARRRRRR